MEMSSPANRNLDDDIDIDFEDYQGGVQLLDDEQMLEDADATRPTTATDDMMEDDVLPGEQVHVEEEVMQDDGLQQQEEDEELIDYGEEGFEGPTADPVISPVIEAPTDVADSAPELVDEEITRPADAATAELPATALIGEVSAEAAQVAEPPTSAEDFLASDVSAHDGVNVEAGTTSAGEQPVFEEADNAAIFAQAQTSTHEEDTAQPPISVITNITAQADTPDTPTDTGLHPMTVRYGELSMPLFKSRRQPDGLLKDDNLANLSLAELIQNCRQQLAPKIGEVISEEQEVLLAFEHMGLMLVEVSTSEASVERTLLTTPQDCRAAFESSLNDVLEVYLQLHQNDGTQEIPPLPLSLSLQLKFQSSFSILKQAAAGGQGMSSFGFLHTAGQGQEDSFPEEYEDGDVPGPHEDAHPEDGFEDQQYDETTYVEHADGTANADYGEDTNGPETVDQHGEAEHEEYYQDEEEYHEDPPEEQFQNQDRNEAAARLDELQADEGHAADTLYHAPQNAEQLDLPVKEQDAHAAIAKGTDNLAESNASSATVQGDSGNGITGEYDDDLIDWDDDTLTSTLSSEQTGDGHDDFSTFLTEYEEDETKAEDHQQGPGDVTEVQDELNPATEDHQASDAQNLGSEDFLNEYPGQDQEYGNEPHQGEQEYFEEYETGEQSGHEEEQYDYNQADTYDEQQEEYHPDYQLGEEDEEQFHTAQDFFNADAYEHGTEHDVYGEEEDGVDDTVGTVIHHDVGEYPEEEGEENFGDELRFDDEATGEQDYSAELQLKPTATGSPRGKRSFDEHAGLDELEDYDRELKKARAS